MLTRRKTEFEHPRVPIIFNLRTDPFERAPITSNTSYDWLLDRAFLVVPAQKYVGDFVATFRGIRCGTGLPASPSQRRLK